MYHIWHIQVLENQFIGFLLNIFLLGLLTLEHSLFSLESKYCHFTLEYFRSTLLLYFSLIINLYNFLFYSMQD